MTSHFSVCALCTHKPEMTKFKQILEKKIICYLPALVSPYNKKLCTNLGLLLQSMGLIQDLGTLSFSQCKLPVGKKHRFISSVSEILSVDCMIEEEQHFIDFLTHTFVIFQNPLPKWHLFPRSSDQVHHLPPRLLLSGCH